MTSTLFRRADLTNPDGTPWNYYGYYPNQAAAIIMSVAFGIAFGIGLCSRIRHRKQIKGRFLSVFLFCPFAKMIGYSLRAASAPEPTDFNLFISSQFFLFLTPQICAAAGYLTFAGLVFFVDGKFSLISHRHVAIIFLGIDVVATSIQGGGAGQLFGANANTWKIGAGLCLGGMIIEFLSFTGFSLVVLHFGYRYRQNKESIPEPDYRIPIVDRILIALYINMAGQFVRATFRMVEFSRYLAGDFIIPEVYQYCFDALPILACVLAFSIILPWQLDYGRAVGDILRNLEWGLLLIIVYPIKLLIRRHKTRQAAKNADAVPEDTAELQDQLPK